MVLWNRGSSQTSITANWSDIGLDPSAVVDARDVWAVSFGSNPLFSTRSLNCHVHDLLSMLEAA